MQAKLCVEGLKLSYEYFCKHDIPHNKVGKLIVAQNKDQIKKLDDLYDRGIKNNVPDLQLVGKDCISKYEAKCQVLKLLCCFCNRKNKKHIYVYMYILYIYNIS